MKGGLTMEGIIITSIICVTVLLIMFVGRNNKDKKGE